MRHLITLLPINMVHGQEPYIIMIIITTLLLSLLLLLSSLYICIIDDYLFFMIHVCIGGGLQPCGPANLRDAGAAGRLCAGSDNAGLIPTLVHLLATAELDIKKESAWALSNAASHGSRNQAPVHRIKRE